MVWRADHWHSLSLTCANTFHVLTQANLTRTRRHVLPLSPFSQMRKCGYLSCLMVIHQLQARAGIQTRAAWLPSPCLWPVCDPASTKGSTVTMAIMLDAQSPWQNTRSARQHGFQTKQTFSIWWWMSPLHSGNTKHSQMYRSYSYSCCFHRDTELSKWVSQCHTKPEKTCTYRIFSRCQNLIRCLTCNLNKDEKEALKTNKMQKNFILTEKYFVLIFYKNWTKSILYEKCIKEVFWFHSI